VSAKKIISEAEVGEGHEEVADRPFQKPFLGAVEGG
jgi:hypothetical protein